MAQALAHDNYTIGWTISLVLQMPYVSIESMGLLTDDTVAGPSDQGARGKSYVNDQVRYGLEIFFLSLSQEMGHGFVNCLWTEAPDNNQKSIFPVLHGYGGNEGVATAIVFFAAKSAILDFGESTETVWGVMRSGWNNDFWFYMFPGGDGTSTFRPSTKTTPHYQGRNTIPIPLGPGATSVTVEFTTDTTGRNGIP